MIKKTLPELPEDHFDELVLYETYVRGSLSRKIELLRDPGSAMHDADLLDGLEKLLEKIAVAIHVSGEGSVDLREFAAHWGGAAQLLWHASQLDQAEGAATTMPARESAAGPSCGASARRTRTAGWSTSSTGA